MAKQPASHMDLTRPSQRLRALNAVLRTVVKPRLARTKSPSLARADFERVARLVFRAPPYLLRQVRPAPISAPELHWVTSGHPTRRGVLLYFHGGAYFAGSPATHQGIAARLARLTGLEVVLPAYRLAPEHPAPAAFSDACAAHAALLHMGHSADEIVLAGDSAGGGLALALLAHLCRTGACPAALVAFSPWVDLALGSASLKTNAAADPFLPVTRIEEVVGYVRGTGRDALATQDPRISPVHATFDAPPPVLIQVGDTEILRDDAIRVAARLREGGGRVTLSQWPQAPHVWHLFDGYIPEARAALEAAAAFLVAHAAEPGTSLPTS